MHILLREIVVDPKKAHAEHKNQEVVKTKRRASINTESLMLILCVSKETWSGFDFYYSFSILVQEAIGLHGQANALLVARGLSPGRGRQMRNPSNKKVKGRNISSLGMVIEGMCYISVKCKTGGVVRAWCLPQGQMKRGADQLLTLIYSTRQTFGHTL